MPNFYGKGTTEGLCVPTGNYRDRSFYVDDASELLPLISIQNLEKQIHVRLEKVYEGVRNSEVTTDELIKHIDNLRKVVQLHGTLMAAKEDQQ